MSGVKGEQQTLPLLPERLVRELAQALKEMGFGQITLIVQDGRVIQIEKTEKIRLTGREPQKKP